MNRDEQIKKLRTLVQDMGWGLFMRDVGSLMAEQSDKTDGEQSGNLFQCSTTIHALDEFFQKCGRFTYPSDMIE